MNSNSKLMPLTPVNFQLNCHAIELLFNLTLNAAMKLLLAVPSVFFGEKNIFCRKLYTLQQ